VSVDFARAYADGMEHNGVVVHFWAGWERRGNGQSSNYLGHLWHHTASPYGSAYRALVEGRSDLSGPLCNVAGNADGSVTIVAAHPANHAGASGGRSMGPLPTTGLFNKTVWGMEIVYPGVSPMTPAQYRTALISAGVVSAVLRRPNAEWCRGHAETSVTGKWDPGFAPPNRTYDLVKMRAQVWPALQAGGLDMDARHGRMLEIVFNQLTGCVEPDKWDGAGWPTERHGVAAKDQPRFTMVDFLRQIDRQLNSALDLAGRPGRDSDNELGHLLSLRAELRTRLDKIDARLTAR